MGFTISQSQHRLPVNLLGAPEVEDDWIAQTRELRCFAGLLDGLVRISELQICDAAGASPVKRARWTRKPNP